MKYITAAKLQSVSYYCMFFLLLETSLTTLWDTILCTLKQVEAINKERLFYHNKLIQIEKVKLSEPLPPLIHFSCLDIQFITLQSESISFACNPYICLSVGLSVCHGCSILTAASVQLGS